MKINVLGMFMTILVKYTVNCFKVFSIKLKKNLFVLVCKSDLECLMLSAACFIIIVVVIVIKSPADVTKAQMMEANFLTAVQLINQSKGHKSVHHIVFQ